jgi:HlyD family secretion protein
MKVRMNMKRESPNSVPELSALRISRDEKPPRRVPRAFAIALGILIVLGAGGYIWTRAHPQALPSASPMFSVVSVEKTSASVVTEGQSLTILSATGYVEAETRADIAPKITSRVTELTVTEGSRVRRGDVIARLDHTDLDAQLEDAQAAWTEAKMELARQRSLHEKELSPRSQLDRAVSQEGSARARVNYARALLDYTVLRAPFDGVVVAKRAHVGEAVSPFGAPGMGSANSGAIVTLVDFASLYAGADVNEANLSKIGPNQPAEIVLDANPGHVYHGELKQIIPAADRQKGTVKVKVRFLDPDEKILPDLSARVSFTSQPTVGKSARHFVEVPKGALVHREGKAGVFVISSDRIAFRPVEAGRESDSSVEITAGLEGGEALVADASAPGLSDGLRVKVKE